MLIIIGIISTIISCMMVNNMYDNKERRIKKYGRVLYLQEELDTWKNEFYRLYLIAFIPFVFCSICQLAIWNIR